MFDVGFAEILLLSVVGLLVLGPERLPKVARTLGRMMRKARSSWTSLKRSIDAELRAEELKKQLDDLKKEFTAPMEDLKKPFQRFQDDLKTTTDDITSSVKGKKTRRKKKFGKKASRKTKPSETDEGTEDTGAKIETEPAHDSNDDSVKPEDSGNG